ncbi:GTPase-activating protein [Ceratobasidium sp. 414]|nr:GTPase-activating protein [Ceratobasidium sp. 414]
MEATSTVTTSVNDTLQAVQTSPRSSSSSTAQNNVLEASKSSATSQTSVRSEGATTQKDVADASVATTNEDEFQDLSLDDDNVDTADPRFSTVPLYTPSIKSKPDLGSPTSSARHRHSSVIGSPIRISNPVKESRRTTLASTSSAGNLPLLLARLEQKSLKEDADPLLKRASVDRTSKLVDDFKRLQVEQDGPAEEGGIDWTFWGEVMANYEEVARTQPKELAQAIENGIPPALRGMMSASKDTALEKVYSDLLKKPSSHEKSIMRDLGRTFPNHEFFTESSGIGQENLFNVLKAYSLLPLDLVFRIMDTVFANGIEAIFGFSLVLLHNNEEAILKLKFDQILEYLKSPLFDSYKVPESEMTSPDGPQYRADNFVQDAFGISRKFTPFMLDSYASEYQAKLKAENAHREEMDSLRTINRNLSQHVKSLEASLAQINSEHCVLVKQLVTSKIEQEELEGELVKFKILYAELMHQKEDDSHRMSLQNARAARASTLR